MIHFTSPIIWVFTLTLVGCFGNAKEETVPESQNTNTNMDATGNSIMDIDNTRRNATTTNTNTDATRRDADNSRNNQRYDGDANKTADNQSNRTEVVEGTRRIRSAITDDGSLSTNAHNVKIIWQDGGYVLKGPVENAEEKNTVERIARDKAGNMNVISQLEILSH
jgi:hyperosmotically inducible periplasmic protein